MSAKSIFLCSAFWVPTAERAVKTFAQSAILAIGAEQFNVISVDWLEIAGFGAGGLVLSLLTSVASAGYGPGDSPSLVEDPAQKAAS